MKYNMKYWLKYVIAVVIILLICLLIKVIPFWITVVLLVIGVASHLFYRYVMIKDVLK